MIFRQPKTDNTSENKKATHTGLIYHIIGLSSPSPRNVEMHWLMSLTNARMTAYVASPGMGETAYCAVSSDWSAVGAKTMFLTEPKMT